MNIYDTAIIMLRHVAELERKRVPHKSFFMLCSDMEFDYSWGYRVLLIAERSKYFQVIRSKAGKALVVKVTDEGRQLAESQLELGLYDESSKI